MKYKILIIAFIFSGTYLYSQSDCKLLDNLEEFIQIEIIEHDNKKYPVKKIIETDSNKCFAATINNNVNYLNYLLRFYSTVTNEYELFDNGNNSNFKNEFFESLTNDTLFSSSVNELVEKTIGNSKKDTISMDDLLNIAVKYFSIKEINKNGHFVGKVCGGLNDIKNTEEVRKPHLEAFCFSSISKHYSSKKYSMYDEFVKSLKNLYKINLGIDKEERLIRAQGGMYFLMRNSETLREMLIEEYNHKKRYLPFVLEI